MSVRSVFFFCLDSEEVLQEDVVCLADGLRQLGIPFYGNCNYWQETPQDREFLIKYDPHVAFSDCDVVVVSHVWPFSVEGHTFKATARLLPAGLFRLGRNHKIVYMDHHDGYRTISWEKEFRQFDLILRCKLNRRMSHPNNMHPWAHAITPLMLDATKNSPPFAKRNKTILINYGASHRFVHGARTLSSKKFEPEIARVLEIDRRKDDLTLEPKSSLDALMWHQTGRRFSRSYYERLNHAQSIACFCGEIIPAAPYHGAERLLASGFRAKMWRAFFEFFDLFDPRPQRSVQWDSFRFWEALAAGALAFNIDLDQYGVELPVMPENWKHYIGIDLTRSRQSIERIKEEPRVMAQVAEQGRSWALEHYTPKKVAERFLKIVG